MRTATRNGETFRYIEVWDDDGEPEPRVYLYSMPVGLNYPHYCVDIETVKEFKAGGEYSVVAWKHMREIEEPKAEAELEYDPVVTHGPVSVDKLLVAFHFVKPDTDFSEWATKYFPEAI